jgi:hypothetical protein
MRRREFITYIAGNERSYNAVAPLHRACGVGGVFTDNGSEFTDRFASPAIKALYTDLGIVPLILSPSDFGKFVAEDTQRWAKVIRTANIKAE